MVVQTASIFKKAWERKRESKWRMVVSLNLLQAPEQGLPSPNPTSHFFPSASTKPTPEALHHNTFSCQGILGLVPQPPLTRCGGMLLPERKVTAPSPVDQLSRFRGKELKVRTLQWQTTKWSRQERNSI